MTQLLDLLRLYVQPVGVQNAITSGPGVEPWVGQPTAAPTAQSEWGTTDPAFVPGGSSNPSNCTLTRYANGDTLVTPNVGATVMRVTCVIGNSGRAQIGDYASVRVTAQYDATKNSVAVGWFNTTLGRPGSILVNSNVAGAPANPAGSGAVPIVAHSGTPIPVTLTDTPYHTVMLTFTRIGVNALQPVILRAGTKVYTGPKVMVETPVLKGPAQQITGDTISIVAQRGLSLKGSTDQLDPGILKAIVKGATYDPGVNNALRPGSAVWLVARATNVGGDNVTGPGSPGPAMWRLVWAGKVLNGDVDYDGAEPRVTIEASDYAAELANVPAPLAWGRYNPLTGADAGGAVSGGRRIAYELYNYAPKVFWSMQDTQIGLGGDASPQVLDKDEGANLLQQLQRIRDTARGWLWLDAGTLGLRNAAGILSPAPEFEPTLNLRFNAGNSPLTNVPRYLATDNPAEAGLKYVGLKTSFSARALCNGVTLHVHTANTDQAYGPYTNQDSLTQWGAQSDDVELHELTGWTLLGAAPDPATTAQDFLKRYATPARYPSSVTLNVTADITPALLSQPYDALRVKRNAPVGAMDSTVRVMKLTHTITADAKRPEKGRWMLQLDTRPIEQTAAVTVTPPDATNSPNGATSGGGSVDATQPIGKRYLYNSTSPFTNTAAIPWDTAFYAVGIPWDAANRWFTVPKAGRYLIRAGAGLVLANQYVGLGIVINGVMYLRKWDFCGAANIVWIQIVDVIKLNAGDHVQITAFSAVGSNLSTLEGSSDNRASCVVTYLGG